MPLNATILSVLFSGPAQAIIHRHDVDASEFEVSAAEFPALVDLLSMGDCIGTLIDPEWLITATHCAVHLKADATFEIAGETIEMANFYLHDDYDNTHHDIALVQLAHAVTHVEPIPWYTEKDEAGSLIWFVGRGDSGTGDTGQKEAAVDGKTRKASNRIETAEDGLISFIFYGPDDAEVTAFEGISGNGDSGGPALVETDDGWVIVGISSFQDAAFGKAGQYGVEEFYTRVSDHDDWIASGMAGDLEAGEPKGCATANGNFKSPASWALTLGMLALFRRNRP